MQLNMKVRADVDMIERDQLLALIKVEIGAVERLFPARGDDVDEGSDEDDLQLIYLVSVEDDAKVTALERIQSLPAVEWVEEQPERRLIW